MSTQGTDFLLLSRYTGVILRNSRPNFSSRTQFMRSMQKTRDTKSEEATPRSAHEGFEQGMGTRLNGQVRFFVRTERTSSKLTFREKLINN